jgi:RNA polymerase sigma-70 factor (ECF subfamily)
MIDWEGILRRDGPAVWKTAWKVLGDRADADECFQEACLAAVEYSKKNKVQQWRPFLHRLATTRAIDRLRQRARRRRRETPLTPDLNLTGGASPPQLAEESEQVDRLRLAITELPPKQAEAFCLFHMSGWSYAEIADALNVSSDLVGVWLQRGRDRLRKILTNGQDAKNEVPS